MMQELKHRYLSVKRTGTLSYGGNQNWSHNVVMRKCGCGVIAATDLLLYLYRNRKNCQTDVFSGIPVQGSIPLSAYDRLSERLRRGYFPVIPPFGTSGFGVVLGLNAYFRKYRLPLQAKWAVWRDELWKHVEKMLADDLPVILTIGQNVPFFWMNHKLRLYVKTDGWYRSSSGVKAHYVVITGMDSRWLRVSSWGKEYYINRKEFEQYVKKFSSYLISNIICLEQKA